MSTEKLVRTIRIGIAPFGETRDIINDIWKRTRAILSEAYKFANEIIRQQVFNDGFVTITRDRISADKKKMAIITEVAQANVDLAIIEDLSLDKDKELAKQISCTLTKEVEKAFVETYGVKYQASPEKSLKLKFPNIPSCVSNTLNQVVYSSYKASQKDCYLGKASIRSYKNTMPVSISDAAITFSEVDGNIILNWNLGKTGEPMQYRIVFGRDRANNRATFDKILKGEIKKCACQIQIKDDKLFLYLPVYDAPKADTLPKIDPSKVVGIDLGINTPAYLSLNDNSESVAVGSKDTFLKIITQMKERRRSIQRNSILTKGGHGRTRKMKALDNLSDKQSNFSDSMNHAISKYVVDWCLSHGAGTIHMENLSNIKANVAKAAIKKNDAKGDAAEANVKPYRLLGDWSYFQLQLYIIYKAKRVGIKVFKINPANTSRICAMCGAMGTRDAKDKTIFNCECGKHIRNADRNAALNIARSTNVIEEC